MQTIGFITVIGLGVTSYAILSAWTFASLPRILFECAERHGRFHGQQTNERLGQGTPAGTPPVAGLGILQGQAA